MGERVSSWFAVALLAVVLGTSYWYAQSLRVPTVTNVGRIGQIDFFAEGVALTGFDPVGRPRYRLFADRMTHFANSDDVDLTKPRLLSLRPDQPQVRATSLTAHAHNNAQTVEMDGNVVVTRAADGPHPAMRLETESLTAVPDDDHFWTHEPVRLQSGDSVMTGDGMDFDNLTRKVELQGHVVGTFPPRSRP